jgi:hypothetical protein
MKYHLLRSGISGLLLVSCADIQISDTNQAVEESAQATAIAADAEAADVMLAEADDTDLPAKEYFVRFKLPKQIGCQTQTNVATPKDGRDQSSLSLDELVETIHVNTVALADDPVDPVDPPKDEPINPALAGMFDNFKLGPCFNQAKETAKKISDLTNAEAGLVGENASYVADVMGNNAGFTGFIIAGESLQMEQIKTANYNVEISGIIGGSMSFQVPAGPHWGLDRFDQMNPPLDTYFNYNFTGNNVVIYQIDTGIMPNHNEIAGRWLGNVNIQGVNDPGNGNDCNVGFNPFTAAGNLAGHATGLASLAGGGGIGVARSALFASFHATKCDTLATTNGKVVSALNAIVNNYIPGTSGVILMATAINTNNALDTTTAQTIAATGMAVITAAGGNPVGGPNSGGPSCNLSPNRLAQAGSGTLGVINVGSISNANMNGNTDVQASYSSYGNCITLYAPGGGYDFSNPSAQSYTNYNFNDLIPVAGVAGTNAYTKAAGSSLSAAYVAGLAAQYIQKFKLANGVNPTPAQVKNALLTNSSAPGSVVGYPGIPNPGTANMISTYLWF